MPDFVIARPVLECRGSRGARVGCPLIALPCPNLVTVGLDPGTLSADIRRRWWPLGRWTAWFACTSCGLVSQYTASDVLVDYHSTRAPGVYHSGANCFSIGFECGRNNCKAQTTVHIEGSGLTEASIRDLLRGAFFVGSLPCGHDFPLLPANRYTILKIMDPIE